MFTAATQSLRTETRFHLDSRRRINRGPLWTAWGFLVACVAIAWPTAAVAADEAQRRPNVIVIMADDIGAECYGCYGSKQYRTPHIDRMAASGMRFTHCYSQPLCTPSRVKLMTGLSNARNYSAFSVLNRDQKTIGQYFKEAGYATAIAGKWQLLGAEHYAERFRGKGTWPHEAGFDHVCLWQVDKLGSRYWSPLLYIDGENKAFGPNDYGPDICCNYLLNFMEKHRDKPFFVYYPMILVHNPFEPTPASESRETRDGQKNFEDMVAQMDQQIGRILAKTEELGIADNTLILVTGDNGTNRSIRSRLNGETIRGGKGTMTDAGTHVALVARWPGKIAAGSVSDAMVDFSDFLPTVLEAAGIERPQNLDGVSFLPQLLGKPGSAREWIYMWYWPRPERGEPSRFARDRRFKLYGDGRFYDLKADPREQSPIAQPTGEAQAAHAKLSKVLETMPAEGATVLRFAAGNTPQ